MACRTRHLAAFQVTGCGAVVPGLLHVCASSLAAGVGLLVSYISETH